MPGQGRLGDKASVPLDAHGCPACPHPGIGPAIVGSPDVSVNKRPALRVDDAGVHAACCGANRWQATTGSQTVFINGKAAHRQTDQTRHCGGSGQLIEGSLNVIVGDSTVAPAVASRGASRGAASATAAAAAASAGATGDTAAATTTPTATTATTSAASAATATTATTSTAGAAALAPAPAPPAEPVPDATFVEIFLVGEDGQPVAGERYRLTTPDGAVHEAFLDSDGHIKIWTLAPGACTLTFPDLDRDAWGTSDA